MPRVWSLFVLFALSIAGQASAHESLPAYLGIEENTPGNFEITLRIPATQGRAPALSPQFPENCRPVEPTSRSVALGRAVSRMNLTCGAQGLLTGSIRLSGLEDTVIDAVLRIKYLDGREVTALLRPGNPGHMLSRDRKSEGWQAYLRLGTEHIAFGFDHLLFVAALLMLVSGFARIVKTLTAFTLAHSITLALAALGYIHVPPAATEAVIALSIVYLARELLSRDSTRRSLTRRKPWLVAFAFGLLHGFGFAGALAEIGLPQASIPMALLMFNLGVELGQIVFVTCMLAGYAILRRMVELGAAARQIASYAIGGLASFWLITRMLAILSP